MNVRREVTMHSPACNTISSKKLEGLLSIDLECTQEGLFGHVVESECES